MLKGITEKKSLQKLYQISQTSCQSWKCRILCHTYTTFIHQLHPGINHLNSEQIFSIYFFSNLILETLGVNVAPSLLVGPCWPTFVGHWWPK